MTKLATCRALPLVSGARYTATNMHHDNSNLHCETCCMKCTAARVWSPRQHQQCVVRDVGSKPQMNGTRQRKISCRSMTCMNTSSMSQNQSTVWSNTSCQHMTFVTKHFSCNCSAPSTQNLMENMRTPTLQTLWVGEACDKLSCTSNRIILCAVCWEASVSMCLCTHSSHTTW